MKRACLHKITNKHENNCMRVTSDLDKKNYFRMKSIANIARILTGLVFVFSGFVKAVDPMGSAIKFEEYFTAFHLDFLLFSALPLSFALSAAEFMIGLNLVAGIKMKFTAWLLLGFMSFFTLLTLILALTNPVSDCGCFGDALKLTNWQTFFKNIILFLPTLLVFIRRKHFLPVFPEKAGWMLVSFNFLMAILLSAYCTVHEPILDFRPYTAGVNIPENMSIPEGAPMDKYEITFIYEKDGVQQEFAESNYPWQDSTWKYVDRKQKLISEGYIPPIHDFSIATTEGSDITQSLLSDSSYVFLFIIPELDRVSSKAVLKFNKLAERATSLGMAAMAITASGTDRISQFKNDLKPSFEINTIDETTIKTILRSSAGLLILYRGTIAGKWNYRDAPEVSEIQENMIGTVLEGYQKNSESRTLIIFAFAIFIVYSTCFALISQRSL
jgi:uncharacterized membrane protein YphA (DoxX/SURF4 family)